MHPSDQLFELIHSLKKQEKRQFKLYAKKYSKSSNFLLLFDAIEGMKRYDEAKLRSLLKGKHFAERLGVAKEYLYALILRSLRDQNPVTPTAKVHTLMRDISVLLDRRLYAHAKKRIKKAKEIASAFDLFGEQYILLDLEGYIPDKDRNEILRDLKSLMKDITENNELGEFAESMRRFKELKGSVRTEEDRKELSGALAGNPYMNASGLGTFGAKLRFHFGYACYYEIIQNNDEATGHIRKIVELYKAYPQFISTEQLAYITNLMRLAIDELRHGSKATYRIYIEDVKSLHAHKQIQPYRELLLFHFEILEATAEQNWKKIQALHSQLPSLLEKYGQEAHSFGKDIRIDYHFLFVKAFFLQQKFAEALEEIHAVMNLPTLKALPYSENNARILQLIIHYELGNLSYLPYLSRSIYRSLLRRDRLYEFEAIILRYLASLSRVKKQKDILPSFENLLGEIKTLSAQSPDREFPWREFYMEWLENKVHMMKTDTLEGKKK